MSLYALGSVPVLQTGLPSTFMRKFLHSVGLSESLSTIWTVPLGSSSGYSSLSAICINAPIFSRNNGVIFSKFTHHVASAKDILNYLGLGTNTIL